ncbi:MAG: SRPBCC family protein [Saprospiraceae bacterium]|nr:SRPBCC family protein [Saprospiraceae bacterium]
MGKLTTIKREIEINQPIEKVWKALADFGNICHGHPGVSKSFITSTQKSGVGATRHCDFTMMGASAEERVTEWNEGKNIKIEVYKLDKMPGIDTLNLDLAIKEQGNKTVLSSTMNYTMKNGFFDFMNSIMMKNMNAKLLDGIMAGHKLYIETGTIVNQKTVLDLTAVKKIN